MPMHLLPVLAVVFMSAGMVAPQAVAQGYPLRPVRVIVPTAAGGNPDFILRPVAQKMSESLKQAFVVDNRPGASGIIGVELAARAPADGYTLLFAAIGHIATPSALYEKLPFDAVRDFAPISKLVDAPFALFVHPSLPAASVRELVALARARPGEITYASFGVGSFPHFLSEAFNAQTGVKMLHVPYKGSAPAASALLAGHVMSGFDALQATLAQVRAKRLRALAIGASKRSTAAAEIPTFTEAGFPGVSASAWFGLFAPAGTPREIVMKLHAEAVKALALPEIREHFEQAGIELVGGTPEQFGAQLRSDIDKFSKIARASNIHAE
jgi:tripartite-type tricarboxylate transporter receptor subunit TctC